MQADAIVSTAATASGTILVLGGGFTLTVHESKAAIDRARGVA